MPSRLKGITKFIDNGGFSPNSAILNFNERDTKLEFQGQQRSKDSVSRTGVLKIPNAFAIAYIIDGQHRIYGYANSKYKASNTIPVVAFKNLDPSDQLELFMQINENQKAVSPTLRITLEEDLYWNSNRLDSRLKALRSSVIRAFGGDSSGGRPAPIMIVGGSAVAYCNGELDGKLGPEMRKGLQQMQSDYGLKVTGTITPETLNALKIVTR